MRIIFLVKLKSGRAIEVWSGNLSIVNQDVDRLNLRIIIIIFQFRFAQVCAFILIQYTGDCALLVVKVNTRFKRPRDP